MAEGAPALVPVRDSKFPGGPVLRVPHADWSAFVGFVKSGRL
ncbi:DUF397 domain-containing protein [Streptomyces sp. DW26H14]